MIQVILSKDEADKIGELRGCHHNVTCILDLFKRGKLGASEFVEKVEPFLMEAERLWESLKGEGL